MGKIPRGLPKSYIKRWGISKLAWRKFRAGALTKGIKTRTKAIKRRIRRTRRRRNPARKRVVRKMARRRRGRRRGGKSMTRTAFKLIRLAALVGPAVGVAMGRESPTAKVAHGLQLYTGYNIVTGRFDITRLARGWGPYVMASLATHGIPKLVSTIRGL